MVATITPPSTTLDALQALQEVYRKKVLPLENAYKFEYFYSSPLTENEIRGKPMVLLLGQYSTGKTTFIQSLVGKEYPGARIGPEPTTDRFVAVMSGTGEDRLIPGNAATIQTDKPFRGLSMFGASFLSKFQVSEVPNNSLLDSLTLIDTPGVLSGDKQRLGRAYDFPAVIKWFAERADMIMIFFDAHKLDISDELKEILAILHDYDDKIRIVLNKSDQVTRQELMHVYGALMWSLSKAIETPEVPRVFVTAFRGHPETSDLSNLLRDEHRDLLQELANLPTNSATRKINDIVKRARLARVHAILVDHLRAQMPSLFGKSGKQTKLLDNLDSELQVVQNRYSIPAGDFPHKEYFLERMRRQSLDSFPKLGSKQLFAIETALVHDIPNLMKSLAIRSNTHPSPDSTEASSDTISSQNINLNASWNK